MDPDKPNAKIQPETAGGTDKLEQRATELAKDDGRTSASDADRNKAMEEMNQTSPPNAGAEGASH